MDHIHTGIQRLRSGCTWPVIRVIALGQLLSLFIAGTGVTSTELAIRGFEAPTAQSALNYAMLACIQLIRVCTRHGSGSSAAAPSSSKPWWSGTWRWILLGAIDVEANYVVVKAYQYTSITSIMLIDCANIPLVMFLSMLMLGTKYSRQHLLGVAVCILGLGMLVISDATSSDGSSSLTTSDRLKGDALCLCGAVLYAVGNVSQETFVKVASPWEWVGKLGAGAFVVSLLQLALLERADVVALFSASGADNAALVAGFAACLLAMYLLSPHFLQRADSAVLNMSLLTSDAWAAIAAVVLFHGELDWLYGLAVLLEVAGLYLYFSAPAVNQAGDVAAQHTRWVACLRAAASTSAHSDHPGQASSHEAAELSPPSSTEQLPKRNSRASSTDAMPLLQSAVQPSTGPCGGAVMAS